MREWIYAALLAVACCLVVVGVATWSIGVACIVAGLLLAALAHLVIVIGEAGATAPVADAEADA